jgi:hypothetical protein
MNKIIATSIQPQSNSYAFAGQPHSDCNKIIQKMDELTVLDSSSS